MKGMIRRPQWEPGYYPYWEARRPTTNDFAIGYFFRTFQDALDYVLTGNTSKIVHCTS